MPCVTSVRIRLGSARNAVAILGSLSSKRTLRMMASGFLEVFGTNLGQFLRNEQLLESLLLTQYKGNGKLFRLWTSRTAKGPGFNAY